MCGTLAKWVSIVERLGEGRLRGLLAPIRRDGCERPARGGALPLQLLQSTKMMVSVHQLVPIIGAGGAECRRRCMGVLAQVRKKGRDLRQHKAQNHDLRRRSHPQNPTCAKNAAHLRQKRC